MNPESKKIVFALEKLPLDLRDFSHDKVFGTTAPLNLPVSSFSISPLPPIILDQIDLDFCTAFASSELDTYFNEADYSLINYLIIRQQPYSLDDRANLAVKYGLVGAADAYINLATQGINGDINVQILSNLIRDNRDYFDPLYFMSKIKQIRNEWQAQGANLRDACNAAVTYGFIKKVQSPFTYDESKPTDKTRDFLANWENWPSALDTLAAVNKIGSYFSVDGPYDAFDNICSALFSNMKTGIPCGVLFGLNWRPEWTYAIGGIINDTYQVSSGDGHCVYLDGVEFINGVPYVRMIQTWGTTVGNKGVFFLPRNVINIEFAAGYGAFIFKKLSKDAAAYYNSNSIKVGGNWFLNLLKTFLKLK